MRVALGSDHGGFELKQEIIKYLEEKNMEYQNALLEKQVQEVQNIYLTMRGWRHDYHNHLQAMKA